MVFIFLICVRMRNKCGSLLSSCIYCRGGMGSEVIKKGEEIWHDLFISFKSKAYIGKNDNDTEDREHHRSMRPCRSRDM